MQHPRHGTNPAAAAVAQANRTFRLRLVADWDEAAAAAQRLGRRWEVSQYLW